MNLIHILNGPNKLRMSWKKAIDRQVLRIEQ
jgi:hypothetical protein